jgi:hypothetical protein
MPKSTSLNFTQNLQNVYVDFCSADILQVIAVSPNNNGSNLTAGTRTFTAASGTVQTGGSASTWTATVTDSRVIGMPVITQRGQYLATPTATGNAATVDSGSTNATFNLRVEFYKELYTASINDAIVKAINVASLDTAARVMSLWIIGTDAQPILIGAVNIPANSGNNGTAATIDLLGGTLLPSLPYDANGKRIVALKAGQKLAVSVPAVTAGTQINVTAQIEEY